MGFGALILVAVIAGSIECCAVFSVIGGTYAIEPALMHVVGMVGLSTDMAIISSCNAQPACVVELSVLNGYYANLTGSGVVINERGLQAYAPVK